MDDETTLKIIDAYFEHHPQTLVRHHIDSYDDFYTKEIFQIFKENNPMTIHSAFSEELGIFTNQCHLYFGGKSGKKIYFGKPTIAENGNVRYMFPNEARLRNMNYSMTIQYDIEIEFVNILDSPEQALPLLNEGSFPTLVGGEIYTKNVIIDGGEEDNNIVGGKGEYFNDMQYGGVLIKKKLQKKNSADIVKIGNLANHSPEELQEMNEEKRTNIEWDATIKKYIQKRTMTLPKIFLGKFPIMVQSSFCILNGMPKEMRFNVGECRNDYGGYFIIDGKEKVIVSQEKFGNNMLELKKEKSDSKHSFSINIKSVSEDVSKPQRTFYIAIVAPSSNNDGGEIVAIVPNVKAPVPLFILFRALGVLADKDIIEKCLLDIDKNADLLPLFMPSAIHAGCIMTQPMALEFIASLTKFGTISGTIDILTDLLLTHIGENNFLEKAYFIGYMVNRLLRLSMGIEQPTDIDHYKYKRVELTGTLISELFREYYGIQKKTIFLKFEQLLYFNKVQYEHNLPHLIQSNYQEIFSERTLETGFKKAFKGNWGSDPHTKRIGVVQDLNRLTFLSALSHLRKTNLPIAESSSKIVGPRLLHCSQFGFIDPIDTPDGANIGLHKTLALGTYISRGYSRDKIIEWLIFNIEMQRIIDCLPEELATMTKIMVNGYWAGVIKKPIEAIQKFLLYRRNALIPIHTSIYFDIPLKIIQIFTDAGRICRPIFYIDKETKKPSYENWKKEDFDNDLTWYNLTTGTHKKKDNWKSLLEELRPLKANEIYTNTEEQTKIETLASFQKQKAIIEYIDPSESEGLLIAINKETLINNQKMPYTHLEINNALHYGSMSNLVIFLENNQSVRGIYSCGQCRQAISMYHTNYKVRMDKTGVVLNNGQIPLVKSRMLKYLNNEENPYGCNTMVAIMCYTSYNVEDAVLINEGSLKRGLFQTSYFTVYETHEEDKMEGGMQMTQTIMNIENNLQHIVGLKSGFDYSKLDAFGLIREGEIVTDKTVLIGLTVNSAERNGIRIDQSITPKKGQLGFVERAFMTDNEEGKRIAKIKIRHIRVPTMGDKFASRAGQKGTIGMVVPEKDMPYNSSGVRPDIIVNPHALPSRMTIGHLVECLVGKACLIKGGFGDTTALQNHSANMDEFCNLLLDNGYEKYGNEIFWNGYTGDQISSPIFFGPNYYMRLKHMVKDKINHRSKGPNTALTRQPVSGRANDGGLRIGEMERDALIAHGFSSMLKESMMERSDKYEMIICNKSGMQGVYNEKKKIFFSPAVDGPAEYTINQNGEYTIDCHTKNGDSFSRIEVPYTFKLLHQELLALNVAMRIITDDNLSQFNAIHYASNNYKKRLLNETIELHDIAKYTQDKINNPLENSTIQLYKKKETKQGGGSKSKHSTKSKSKDDEITKSWDELEKDLDFEIKSFSKPSIIKPDKEDSLKENEDFEIKPKSNSLLFETDQNDDNEILQKKEDDECIKYDEGTIVSLVEPEKNHPEIFLWEVQKSSEMQIQDTKIDVLLLRAFFPDADNCEITKEMMDLEITVPSCDVQFVRFGKNMSQSQNNNMQLTDNATTMPTTAPSIVVNNLLGSNPAETKKLPIIEPKLSNNSNSLGNPTNPENITVVKTQ